MKNHYLEFLRRAELPADADAYLKSCIDKIIPEFEDELKGIIDTLYSTDFSIKATAEGRKQLSDISQVNFYTVNFIFLVCASKQMRLDFAKRSIADEVFWDTILDLKYKLFECRQVKGVWGNFVEFWYDIFYRCDIYKLGRLEYERCIYPAQLPALEVDGIEIKEGTELISVHIPSSGALLPSEVEESFAMAERFFADHYPSIKPLVFFCESWLLYEPYREVFAEGGNMQKFMDAWSIKANIETDDFGDFWRVYGKEYDGDIDSLPEDTTLRRNMKKFMQSGKKNGFGIGFRPAKYK